MLSLASAASASSVGSLATAGFLLASKRQLNGQTFAVPLGDSILTSFSIKTHNPTASVVSPTLSLYIWDGNGRIPDSDSPRAILTDTPRTTS